MKINLMAMVARDENSPRLFGRTNVYGSPSIEKNRAAAFYRNRMHRNAEQSRKIDWFLVRSAEFIRLDFLCLVKLTDETAKITSNRCSRNVVEHVLVALAANNSTRHVRLSVYLFITSHRKIYQKRVAQFSGNSL